MRRLSYPLRTLSWTNYACNSVLSLVDTIPTPVRIHQQAGGSMLYTHLVVSIASRRRVAGLRLDLEKASIILCNSKREVICDKNDRTSARTCTTVGAIDVDSIAWIMLEF